MSHGKKNNQIPRRKRMDRKKRLQSVKSSGWISKYSGKNLVRWYANWFAVDLLCAITELRMLGVAIDEKHEESVKKSVNARIEQKRRRKEKFEPPVNDWQDENFAYIAGYTSWGFPYGITWEEMENMDSGEVDFTLDSDTASQ